MSRSLKAIGRVTVTMALAAGTFAAAPPAQAAGPLTVDLTCEGVGRSRVACWYVLSGGTAPFDTRWYYNGNHYPAYDDRVHTSWPCTPGGVNQFTVAVVDATFEIAADTHGASCRTGNP